MPTFTVPQSGGTITISSTAAGFTQNSNPYQYYLNSDGTSQQSDRFTFTFADGRSFYLTGFNQFGGFSISSNLRNVVGIPSTADAGYGSTINVIGGVNFTNTYDIYDATSNVLLVDNFQPQVAFRLIAFCSQLPTLSIHRESLRLERQRKVLAPLSLLRYLQLARPCMIVQ